MRAIARVICALLVALGLESPPVAATVPPAQPLSLVLTLDRDHLYQGESASFSVTLRVEGATVRNIGFPTLQSPRAAAADFGPPEEIREETGAAQSLSYRFRGRTRFLSAGPMALGPAALECDVLESATGSAGFFGGMEARRVQVQSPPLKLTVRPLPGAGRPSSFRGGVGKFSMRVGATPGKVAAGEPITVRTVVSGDGDLQSARCPELSGPYLKTYPVQRRYRSGALDCEQVVIPGPLATLPPVQWSYFDPEQSAYRTLVQSVPSKVVTAQPPPAGEARPAPRQAPTDSPHWQSPLTSLPLLKTLAGAIFAAAGVSAWRMRRRKSSHPPPPFPSSEPARGGALPSLTEAMSALDRRDVDKFYSAVFAILQVIAANRCSLENSAAVASLPPLPCGLAPELYDIMARCHQVRYGRLPVEPRRMKDDLDLLLQHLSG